MDDHRKEMCHRANEEMDRKCDEECWHMDNVTALVRDIIDMAHKLSCPNSKYERFHCHEGTGNWLVKNMQVDSHPDIICTHTAPDAREKCAGQMMTMCHVLLMAFDYIGIGSTASPLCNLRMGGGPDWAEVRVNNASLTRQQCKDGALKMFAEFYEKMETLKTFTVSQISGLIPQLDFAYTVYEFLTKDAKRLEAVAHYVQLTKDWPFEHLAPH